MVNLMIGRFVLALPVDVAAHALGHLSHADLLNIETVFNLVNDVDARRRLQYGKWPLDGK